MNTSLLLGQQQQQSPLANYYSVQLTSKLTLICVDFYEISVFGFEPHESVRQEAEAILSQAAEKKMQTQDEREIQFLDRYAYFNGAMSQRQMDWLRVELDKCRSSGARALVCGHIPLCVEASDKFVAWNAKEALELMCQENVCCAYLSGHYHPGGYYYDGAHDMHHLTVQAILETPHDAPNSYLVCRVYHDRLTIHNNSRNTVEDIVIKL